MTTRTRRTQRAPVAVPRNPARARDAVVKVQHTRDDGPDACSDAALNRPQDTRTDTLPSWQRPPFERGNLSSLAHGAYSERAIAERAEAVACSLLEVYPWLAELRYAPSVYRYCTAAAREALADQALRSARTFSPRLLEAATSAARLSWQMADALGMSPAGAAKLKVLAAGGAQAEMTIAELAEQGRQIREDADARLRIIDGEGRP